jgi:hypothetical protein
MSSSVCSRCGASPVAEFGYLCTACLPTTRDFSGFAKVLVVIGSIGVFVALILIRAACLATESPAVVRDTDLSHSGQTPRNR